MPDRDKVIKGLASLRDVCNAKADMAIGEGRTAWAGYASVVHLALALLREQEGGGWISADKRPPKQGRYLVWGLTRITPDHYDVANGFWEIQPAFWFERSGWDRKVKFWQMLPEPPKEVS